MKKQVNTKMNLAGKIKKFFTGGNTGQKIIFTIVFFLFCIYAITLIFPFVMLFALSLEDPITYEIKLGFGQQFSLPDKPSFGNYIYAFSKLEYRGTNLFGLIFNSIWFTAISVIEPLFFNSCVAYALSKYKFKLRNVYYNLYIFMMIIPIMGTEGARMNLYANLGLYNTGPLLKIVGGIGAGGMTLLILMAYFRNISWEYSEAAFIDGAGHFTVFFKIMLPMCLPVAGAMALLNGMSAWNEYQSVLLYNPDWSGLAAGLYGLSRTLPRLGNTPAYYAALIIALIPILVVFSLFSDRIMANFSVGGLKG